MVSMQTIEEFLSSKKLIAAGVSGDPEKTSRSIFENLNKKGFDIIPVNPNFDSIDGQKCYRSVDAVPGGYDKLLVVTSPKNTLDVLKSAAAKNIKSVWIQQGAQSVEALEFAKQNNMNVIHKKCILMFAGPVDGIHNFHRRINKIFGLLPK